MKQENMKSAKRAIFIAALICLSFIAAPSQNTSSIAAEKSLVLEQGVAPHKELDGIYRQFSEGYKKLDAASVVDLYSDTAAYLAPGSPMQIGRQKVSDIFTGFFDSVKKRNGRLEISFRILQREVDRNLAYDVGIYTLTSFDEKGASSGKDSGKFVVVARRGKGGIWRFQVDGYNSLPKEK
jgi:ketosteroid isomerase-like protein